MDEPNSFLATDIDYGDFVLEFEYKIDSIMNSGVQLKSESKSDYQIKPHSLKKDGK